MKEYKGKFDRIGIAVSLVCVLHCVILPVTMTTLSLAGMEIMHNIVLETITILAAVVTGSLAMRKGYQKHGQVLISIIFVAGITLMIAGNAPLLKPYELISKLAGALLVISAHVKNYLLSRNLAIIQKNIQSSEE